MSDLDRQVLAERVAAVMRHLDRVQKKLPSSKELFTPSSDATDAVILHLWQATQICIDIAVGVCVHHRLGVPSTYAEAFQKLGNGGFLDKELALRLSKAAGFRNRIVHAYENLDLAQIYTIAQTGPEDLKAFLAAVKSSITS